MAVHGQRARHATTISMKKRREDEEVLRRVVIGVETAVNFDEELTALRIPICEMDLLSEQARRKGSSHIYIYIYIYILYIRSPGLPLIIGSPGQTVQSGRAGPGPDVYKRKYVVLGISFYAPSRFIIDGCQAGGGGGS
jgi:hypothetical protein